MIEERSADSIRRLQPGRIAVDPSPRGPAVRAETPGRAAQFPNQPITPNATDPLGLTNTRRFIKFTQMISKPALHEPAPSGYVVGDENLIRVTPTAAKRVAGLLSKRAPASGVLRIAVVGGGCSGFSYKMDIQDAPQNRDIVVDSGGIRVVIDSKSASHVAGSVLDYAEGLQESGFRFRNPNAVSTCSCGESFSR